MYELIIIGGVAVVLAIALFQWSRKEPSYHAKARILCAIAKENSLTHRMAAMHHLALADMYQQQVQLLCEESDGALAASGPKQIPPVRNPPWAPTVSAAVGDHAASS